MEKEIIELIEGPLSDIGIDILKVAFEVERKKEYLRVYIDANDILTCVKATKVINPILDLRDPIERSYILEVLSKGEENGN